jgi:hypothetical protein
MTSTTIPAAKTRSQRWAADAVVAWPPRALPAIAVFAVLAAVAAYRILADFVIDGQPALHRYGLIDYRDAIYYPVRAFVDGANPYDVATYVARYPIGLPFPLYSPMALLLYLPTQLVSLSTGATIFLALNIALLPLLAYLTLRLAGVGTSMGAVFAVAAVALASRGGYVTLSLGQCTVYVTIAVYVALLYADSRPWMAAVALALATLKPTFGVPVALLMLAAGQWRVVAGAAALSGALTIIPLAVLTARAGGIAALIATLAGNYHRASEGVEAANAATSPLRLDLSSLIARFVGESPGMVGELAIGIAVVIAGMLLIRRLRNDAGGQLRFSIVVLTTILCVYHQGYDVLLLLVPFVGVLLTPWVLRAGGTPSERIVLAAALAVPLVNYVLSRSLLESIGHSLSATGPAMILLASVNGAAMIAAFVVCAGLVRRHAAARGAESRS